MISLVRAVRKEFANKVVREAFIADILGILRKCPTSSKDLDRTKSIVHRPGRHFGLPSKITREVTGFIEDCLKAVTVFFPIQKGIFISAKQRLL